MPHILEITSDNEHASVPPYMRPQTVAPNKSVKKRKQSSREAAEGMVLQYYKESSEPLTADDCAAMLEAHFDDGRPRVNSAGPAVVKLRKAGLIRRTGLMKETRMGAQARAHELVKTVN